LHKKVTVTFYDSEGSCGGTKLVDTEKIRDAWHLLIVKLS